MDLDKLQKGLKCGTRKNNRKDRGKLNGDKRNLKDKKDITYYNYNRKGHYANECRQPKREKQTVSTLTVNEPVTIVMLQP